jgi:hypothetical protein
MLKQFQRRCYHYLSDLPREDRTLEWLALMRHFGAPTRLLDWTYSFFVAVFNAIECTQGTCAVYALDSDEMDMRLSKQAPWRRYIFHKNPYVDKAVFEYLFGPESKPTVYAVNPFRLNQRLAAQQGLFLVPASIRVSFEENLSKLFASEDPLFTCDYNPPEKLGHRHKIVIATSVHQRNEILRHLHQMNINRASLYTDLEGLAKSLTTLLASPDILAAGGSPPFDNA